MTLLPLMMASAFFQTRNLSEWLEDDGPASRAHARPAEPPLATPEGLRSDRDPVAAK